MIHKFTEYNKINENSSSIKDRLAYLNEIGYDLIVEKGKGTQSNRFKDIVPYPNENDMIFYTVYLVKIWTEEAIIDWYGDDWKEDKEALENLGKPVPNHSSDYLPLKVWVNYEKATKEDVLEYIVNEFSFLYNTLGNKDISRLVSDLYEIQDNFNIETTVKLLNVKNISINLNNEWEYFLNLVYRWYQTAKAIDYITTGQAGHGYMTFQEMDVEDFKKYF